MPVRTVHLAPRVQEQVADVLVYTHARFGERKAAEYRQLIADALDTLAANAELGRARPEIASDAWSLHLAQRGHKARHLFLYRIEGDRVEVNHFRYDAMDLPAHWDDEG